MRWAYGRTADPDVDGGVDYSGDGGWTASGTFHISNTNDASVFRDYYGVANNDGASIPVNTKI